MSKTAQVPDRPLLAAAWMALSGIGFTGMGFLVKTLSTSIPHFELVFFRCAVNTLIVIAIMAWKGEEFFPKGMPLLIARGVAGFASVSCLFYSLGRLPLSIAMLLNWSAPVFVVLFSRVLLHEKLGAWRLMWIAVAFGGLTVLLDPRISDSGIKVAPAAIAFGMMGAVFGGLAYVAVRAATSRVGVHVIVLYFVAIGSILSAPMAYRDYKPPEGKEWLLLIAVGVFATLGQITMTQGYRYAPAGLVSGMGLMTAGFSALAGWALFHEQLGLHQWLGMLVLAAAIAAMTGRSKFGAAAVPTGPQGG